MSEILRVEVQGFFSVKEEELRMSIGEAVLPNGYGIIYIVTDTENNKLYVGQSTKPLRERWKEHVRYTKGEGSLYPLAKAIKEYGVQVFYVNVLEVVLCDDLHGREKFWIDTLRTHTTQNGYNVTAGGVDGNKVLVDSSKILEVYHEVKSIRETAKILDISRDIVAHRIKKSGATIYSNSEVKGTPLKVTCPSGETAYFISKIELANWLVDNNIGKSRSVDSVRKKIGKKHKDNYYGYVIEVEK